MDKKSWTEEEKGRLRVLKLDPVQNKPEKLTALVRHFLSGGSKFAVTEGSGPVQVSKGLASKVESLCQRGLLHWVLGAPAPSEILPEQPKNPVTTEPGHQSPQALEVKLATNRDGLISVSHDTATLLDPITVFISVLNHGSQMIRYLQMHVWLPRHYTFWNPDVADSGGWRGEASGELPLKLQEFEKQLDFNRYVVRLSPESGFFLMPSPQPLELPPLEIMCRSVVGGVPLLWQLEASDSADVAGVLLLWCDQKGLLRSESLFGDVDIRDLKQRSMRFLRRNGVEEMPRWRSISDLLGKG